MTGRELQNRKFATSSTTPIPIKIRDIIIGTLLGDAQAERRGNTRIVFKQSIKHAAILYLLSITILRVL